MVAVIVVEFTKVTPVAGTPPKVTVAPLTNSVPVMVTAVPPSVVPLVGVTEVTVGAQAVGGEATSALISAGVKTRS